MTIAHSYSTPPREPQADDGGAWPVLARIPDLSVADRQTPQRSPRPIGPARSNAHRFDAPPARRPAAQPAQPAKVRTEIGTHPAHLSQPPAHHLNQRAARFEASDDRILRDSPVLPDWDPFTIPGRRLPDSFAPILSFLVMVALFTVAGTSVLMLRSAHRQPVSATTPAAEIENTAATSTAPTARGPLGASATRLLPAPQDEPTTVAFPPIGAAPNLSPPDNADATRRDVTRMDSTSPAAVPTIEKEHPESNYPEPILPPTIEVTLPQAAMTNTPLPIARFSGQILEAPTRQAKNDDQSSIH